MYYVLQKAILSYNSRQERIWNFDTLHELLLYDVDLQERFFTTVLPRMVDLLLSLPEICTAVRLTFVSLVQLIMLKLLLHPYKTQLCTLSVISDDLKHFKIYIASNMR